MMIVLVKWYIKPDRVDDFKDWWYEKSTPVDVTGMFAEFLSEPIRQHYETCVSRYESRALRPTVLDGARRTDSCSCWRCKCSNSQLARAV